MVAPAGAAGVGEHEDPLGVIHERRGLGEVRRRSTVLDDEAAAPADDTAGTAGDLSDHIGTKSLDDLIQGARHRRQRCQLLDEAVASRDGFTALDWLAIAIRRPGTE